MSLLKPSLYNGTEKIKWSNTSAIAVKALLDNQDVAAIVDTGSSGYWFWVLASVGRTCAGW